MTKLPGCRGGRRQIVLGAPDESLTGAAGLLAVGELLQRLDVVATLDTHIGPIKQRARGATAGQVLVALAGAQLAGEQFLVGLDRRRADTVGQECFGQPAIPSTTAAGLARRVGRCQREGVEAAISELTRRVSGLLPHARAKQLRTAPTLDVDATDVECYGRSKQGITYNYEGQRAGRAHVVAWAEAGIVLAADLLAGNEDPRATALGLLHRALASLPAQIAGQPTGRPRVRGDVGYFTGALAHGVVTAGADFALGVVRNPAVWRAAATVAQDAWIAARDMPAAEVAVCGYVPAGWPPDTRCVVRRVRIPAEQISTDPRARRRRTIPKDQLALALEGQLDVVFGYSFILTNLDVSTPDSLVEFERWYRDRTDIEDRIRDAKHGAALRHLPSGHREVNAAWMWGALLAINLSAWLQELTGLDDGAGRHRAHATRLRRELIHAPGRLIRHARRHTLRLTPGHHILLAQVLTRLRALPSPA